MRKLHKNYSFGIALLAILTISAFAQADPITVTGTRHLRRTNSENDVNIPTADLSNSRLFFGANAVPNGFANPPTTGVATQGTATRTLNFDPTSTDVNQFDRSIPYDANLTGSWTLTFTNGTDQAVATTPSVGSTTPAMPFVQNMSISGSGITPTFSWTIPTGAPVDSVRIQIWDVGNPFPGSGQAHSDIIHNASCNPSLPVASNNCSNFSSSVTDYTLPSTLSSGQTLQRGHTYAVSINLDSLRDTSLTDTAHNIKSDSRSFFDFTPPESGDYQSLINCASSPSCPVYLPMAIHTGAYEFSIGVIAGQTYFIDPLVATGFVYQTGLGNPNFASVLLPDVGNGQFDLLSCDGSPLGTAYSGVVFNFSTGGVSCFQVRGIETSADMDPNNVTAFVTGLTFTGNGSFTGTMTPITTTIISLTCSVPNDGGANLRQADLENCNLAGFNLSGDNLQHANLQGASLQFANLQDANLGYVDFQDADLEGALLLGDNLSRDNLQGANLQGANLQGTNLQGANLQGADLSDANLENANLQGANLLNANLIKADLSGANLQNAITTGAIFTGAITTGCNGCP